ncbi:MAG: cardiolipin synthase [Lachnospiraceae bacterium]|nr:cardiolipin synthase [Lachnospiraceae bacterium]
MHEFEWDKVLFLEKGKKGLHRVIFGRTLLILLSFLIQFGVFFVIFTLLSQYLTVTVGAYVLFIAVIQLIIVNNESNPAMKVSWIVVIMVVPVVGGMLYLYVQLNLGSRVINHRLSELYEITKKYVKKNPETVRELKEISPSTANLAEYLANNGNYQVYQNTRVTYFPLGEDKFKELLIQLEKAEKFIFIEYFIICEGYMWGRVLKILEEKVKQGVEVRVMYDGFNTLTYLPAHYPQNLEKLGIRCKVFSPIRPVFSTTYNNRDHRKVLVIDGHTGFTGGINLADEYINQKNRFGHWKDTAVMLQGEAVQGLTQMFLHMWNITEKDPVFEPYLNPALNHYVGTMKLSKGFVIPYGDSPFDDEHVSKLVYLDIINRADRYVHIMTPYLILDYELMEAITFAAKRGVDVKIILPHIPDKITAFALAKTHYSELLRSGVHIYEYLPGFVHAKGIVSDDEKAVVGTVNFDYRSLYLHFEDAVFLYQVPENAEIEADVQETLKKCHEITMEDVKHEKFYMKLLGILLKVLSPLM